MTSVDRSVAVLAYPGMSVFETGIVTEVFGLPRPELEVDWYRLTVCAERPGPVPVVGGPPCTPRTAWTPSPRPAR